MFILYRIPVSGFTSSQILLIPGELSHLFFFLHGSVVSKLKIPQCSHSVLSLEKKKVIHLRQGIFFLI